MTKFEIFEEEEELLKATLLNLKKKMHLAKLSMVSPKKRV